jgi:hypothetical protein
VDLFGAYPRSANVDVRVRGGTGIVRAKLGTGILPANWLAYEKREVPIRTFLFQVDFFSHFLHPLSAELYGRATLEALAAGCVTFLPHSAASAYEDAAICCKPAEVQEVVNHFYSERAAYRRQSVRATEWVRDTCQEKSYVELVSALV